MKVKVGVRVGVRVGVWVRVRLREQGVVVTCSKASASGAVLAPAISARKRKTCFALGLG